MSIRKSEDRGNVDAAASDPFHDHPNVQALRAQAGSEAVDGLLRLAAFAKANRPQRPSFTEADNLKEISGFSRSHNALMSALQYAGFIQAGGGNYMLTELAIALTQ